MFSRANNELALKVDKAKFCRHCMRALYTDIKQGVSEVFNFFLAISGRHHCGIRFVSKSTCSIKKKKYNCKTLYLKKVTLDSCRSLITSWLSSFGAEA